MCLILIDGFRLWSCQEGQRTIEFQISPGQIQLLDMVQYVYLSLLHYPDETVL